MNLQPVQPSDSKRMPPHSGNNHGVVLVTVLWIMVGLSLLALTLAATVRTEATLARASGEAEQAYFFARGALEAVLYRLAYPDPDPRKQQALFPYAGGMNHYRLSSRQMRCHLALMDEAGKLDLNAARPETLERLLRIVGSSPPRAETLAAAVVAWRTPGPRAGVTGSGGRPFRFVEELLQVPGMGRELLYGRPRRHRDGRTVFQRGLMDFLTVYTATSRVNVNYAAPEVLAALPGMGWEEARSLVAARPEPTPGSLRPDQPGPGRGPPLSDHPTLANLQPGGHRLAGGKRHPQEPQGGGPQGPASPAGTPAVGLV